MKFSAFYHGEMGAQELICLTSFLKNGHQVELYSYEREKVPPYFHWRNAEEILPRSMLFYENDPSHKGSLGAFSDVFRWELLKKMGGIWIDTDIFCISERWPEQDIFFAWQDEALINGAVMKFPPHHDLVCEAADLSKEKGPNCTWGEVGPILLTQLVKKYGIEDKALPPISFYPAQYWWATNIRDEGVSATKLDEFRELGSVCIHLWNECLRQSKIDKNQPPKPGSLLSYMVEEYGLERFYMDFKDKLDFLTIKEKLREIFDSM